MSFPCRDVTYKQEVMIFRLGPQIFEDSLLPVPLHVIPIVYHPMANRIVYSITRRLGVREGLVSDEEIEVFYTAFGCQVSGFRGYCGGP